MTGVELPSLVIKLFQAEIAEIQASLITEISADYNLDRDELINRYIELESNMEIISSKIMKLSITKCQPEIESEVRCNARIWNKGMGARCKRKQQESSNLCKFHKIKHDNDQLKYGLISEPRPAVFKNLLRKKKIY